MTRSFCFSFKTTLTNLSSVVPLSVCLSNKITIRFKIPDGLSDGGGGYGGGGRDGGRGSREVRALSLGIVSAFIKRLRFLF